MNDGACRCFAIRRVNPLAGVLQVIEGPDARAYSPNGAVWEIQVLSARPDHTWRSFGDVAPIEQFFNFGLWDAEGGLHKIPANPVLDIGRMKAAADRLVSILETVAERLPFTLIDNYECWSTDDSGNPVALLASTESPDTMYHTRVTNWLATRTTDHGFVSDSLLRRGVAVQGDLGPHQHAGYLERAVQQSGPQRTWFRREPDGRGERLGETSDEVILESSAFPSLGLNTDWSDQQTAELVQDYLAWSAPHLLLWQHINAQERDWLEKEACRQAVALAAVHRLLPEIVDADRIGAARVEARLRRPI